MTIVVYSSHSGSSKKYAESFAEHMGYECHSFKEKYDRNQNVVFFGWLRGPMVVGLNTVDREKLLAVATVSLEQTPEFGWNKVKDMNKIEVPMYHLRGWVDRKKLNLIDRFIFVLLCVRMKLRGLDNHTQPLFDAMMEGGSFYDESGLESIELFCRNK